MKFIDLSLKIMHCNLCQSDCHESSYHDIEILNWLSEDPANGQTNFRMYYMYKRREKASKYKGLREDVWWMMHTTPSKW